MAAPAAIEVQGLKEFRAELKKLGPEWTKMLAKANKAAALLIVPVAKSDMSSLGINARSGNPSGRPQAAIAPTIRAVQSAVAAQIKVGSGLPYVFGALLGSKTHPQFPEWIGNSWTPGDPGGPYGLGAAIAAELPAVLESYWDAVQQITANAFPD